MGRAAFYFLGACLCAHSQQRHVTFCEAQNAGRDGQRIEIEGRVTGELAHGHRWLPSDGACGNSAEPTIPLIGQNHGDVRWQQWVQFSDAKAFLLFHDLLYRGQLAQHRFLIRGTIRRNPWWWFGRTAARLGLLGGLLESTDVAPVALIIDSVEVFR